MAWTCEYCSAEFDTCEELVNHIQSEHPGQPYPTCPAPPPPEPPEPPIPPPPTPLPPDEEPEFIETYREVDIYWLPTLEIYWAQVAVGYTATGGTLDEIKTNIDEILDFLNPPEDPDEGLLAQIIAWVESLFDTIVTPLSVAWDNFITFTWPALGSVLTTLGDEWDSFKTTTLITITDTLTALGDMWDVFTDETLPGILDTVDEKLGILHDAVLEDLTDLGTAIDTKLTDLGTYIDDKVAEIDTVGFFEDPVAYISGVFAMVGLLRETSIIESFLEGFEEGLEE